MILKSCSLSGGPVVPGLNFNVVARIQMMSTFGAMTWSLLKDISFNMNGMPSLETMSFSVAIATGT